VGGFAERARRWRSGLGQRVIRTVSEPGAQAPGRSWSVAATRARSGMPLAAARNRSCRLPSEPRLQSRGPWGAAPRSSPRSGRRGVGGPAPQRPARCAVMRASLAARCRSGADSGRIRRADPSLALRARTAGDPHSIRARSASSGPFVVRRCHSGSVGNAPRCRSESELSVAVRAPAAKPGPVGCGAPVAAAQWPTGGWGTGPAALRAPLRLA